MKAEVAVRAFDLDTEPEPIETPTVKVRKPQYPKWRPGSAN
jgi:hypothetical protein